MPELLNIELHVCKRLDANGRCEDSETIEERPESQDAAALKLQIGRMVRALRDKGYSYFYVVLKARKSDGSFGYRTVIPKTML